jgi:hypothetical protein
MNSGIKELHQQLISTHRNLSQRLGRTANLDEADAILREMEEVNFRVMMAGRLLFKQTTATIDTEMKTVVSAAADLDKSIARTETWKDMISKVGEFLTKADKLLDDIKLAGL